MGIGSKPLPFAPNAPGMAEKLEGQRGGGFSAVRGSGPGGGGAQASATLTRTLALALALAPTLTLAPTLALPLTCAGERWPQEDQGFLGAAQVRAGRADGGRQGASAHAAADLHRALRQLSPCRRP